MVRTELESILRVVVPMTNLLESSAATEEMALTVSPLQVNIEVTHL